MGRFRAALKSVSITQVLLAVLIVFLFMNWLELRGIHKTIVDYVVANTPGRVPD